MRICRAATKIVHPWHLSTYTEPLTGPQSTVQFVSSSSRNAPKLSHLRSLRVTSREREWPRGSNSQGDGAAVELLKVEIRRAPVHGGHGAGGARQRAVCAAAKPRLSQNRRRRHWRRRSGRWPRDVCGGSRRRRHRAHIVLVSCTGSVATAKIRWRKGETLCRDVTTHHRSRALDGGTIDEDAVGL